MAISFPFHSSTIAPRGKYGPRLWNGAQTVHTGVDFAVAGNRAVPAADSGTITAIQYTALKGYQVEITHSSSARTRYHMLRSDVTNTITEGEYVTKGQTIGHIAPQKYSPSAAWTGPHLHWEVWLKLVRNDGTPYDVWRHVDPQQRWANAGGPNGYTPSEPAGTAPATGGPTTPVHQNESDDEMSLSPREAQMLARLHDYFTKAEPNLGRAEDGDGLKTIERGATNATHAANYVAVGEPGVRTDGQLAALVRSGNTNAALAARDAKYAADYVAVGQSGVRNDGQTAALIRQGVNAALAAKLTAADIDAIATAVKNKLQ